jgi:hypothetical protein
LFRQAQLQGVTFKGAQLQAATLHDVFVWRAEPPMSKDATSALVDPPQLEATYMGIDCRPDQVCNWSVESFTALKSLIETLVPAGFRRDSALKRIARLETPPYVQDPASAKAWTELAEISSQSADRDPEALAKTLKFVGCAVGGAGTISHLIPQLRDGWGRLGMHSSQAAEVAAAFLDEAKCPGGHGLSEVSKADLLKIRDRAPVLPSPGAAAR